MELIRETLGLRKRFRVFGVAAGVFGVVTGAFGMAAGVVGVATGGFGVAAGCDCGVGGWGDDLDLVRVLGS